MPYFISFYNPGVGFGANWHPRETKRTDSLRFFFFPQYCRCPTLLLEPASRMCRFGFIVAGHLWAPIATVERGPTKGARFGNTGAMWVICCSALFVCPLIWETRPGGFPNVRASNEGLPRPRVARAQGITRQFFFPSSLAY